MNETEFTKFRLNIPEEDLVLAIRHFGTKAYQGRQVVRRFHNLLPAKLVEIKNSRSHNASASHALREALVENKYQNLIDEYIAAHFETIQARINYETYFMLYQARQSLRKARRVKNNATQHTKWEP